MMKHILLILLMLGASVSANATSCADYGLSGQQPWVAYGGVNLNAGQTVVNPPTANLGLRGEVSFLPYTPPPGQILFFEGVTLETLWTVDLVPFVSPDPNAINIASPVTALDTYTAGPSAIPPGGIGVPIPNWNNRLRTQQFSSGFQIPFGLILNIAFRAGTAWPTSGGPWDVEWSMHGFLCSAPPSPGCAMQDVHAGAVC